MRALSTVDKAELRRALGRFATGVAIVTTVDGHDRPVGVTVNSFNSVSLSPPLVLWSLDDRSLSRSAFEQCTYFSVHILSADQADLARRFAARGTEKFSGIEWERGHGGIPMLTQFASRLICRRYAGHDGGDHRIFIGEVIDVASHASAALTFFAGEFGIAFPKSLRVEHSAGTAPAFRPDFLIYLLDRCFDQLNRPFYAEVTTLGLSLEAGKLLAVMSTGQSHTITSLLRLDALLGSPTIRAVGELESAGLVQTDPNGSGRVSLTNAGHDRAKAILALGRALEAHALRELSAPDVAALRTLLTRLVEATDPGLPDPFLGTFTRGPETAVKDDD